MSTATQRAVDDVIRRYGQTITIHQELGGVNCPCKTPMGDRDPEWHVANPGEPVCNAEGIIPTTIRNVTTKAFLQPIQSSRSLSFRMEYILEQMGRLEADDQISILPARVGGVLIDFLTFSRNGVDYIEHSYHGKFLVVAANLIPDPLGPYEGHWELGLRKAENSGAG